MAEKSVLWIVVAAANHSSKNGKKETTFSDALNHSKRKDGCVIASNRAVLKENDDIQIKGNQSARI